MSQEEEVVADAGQARATEAMGPMPAGDATEMLPDVVVLDENPATERTERFAAGQPTPGEDVYVILPEGEGADIPFVETEVLPEEAEAQTTEPQTENIGFRPEAFATGTSSAGTELVQPDTEINDKTGLDQFAAQLEGEILGSDDAALAAGGWKSRGGSVAEDSEAARFDAAEPVAAAGRIVDLPASEGRTWLRVAVPVAAALLLGACGLYYYLGGSLGWEGMMGGFAGGGSQPLVNTATGPGSTGATPVDAAVTPPGDPNEEAGRLLAAARESFRAQVHFSIQLGFGGDNSHE